MRNDEKTLFIKLCSFLDADEEALAGLLNENATPAVLGQLFFNRMQGAAYETLRKSGLLGAVSREFRNALKGAWEQNCQRNESFYTAVKLLSELLAGKEGKYAMLKGAVLCGKYPNGCRTSNDIDLLLLPEHITELGDVLEAAGFRQGEIKSGAFVPATRREIIASRMMRGETVPYILELRLPMMQYLEVDLNFSLDYKNSGTDTLKKMLSQTEQISVGNTPLQTLCEEDFFLHLCGHLYKEAATLPPQPFLAPQSFILLFSSGIQYSSGQPVRCQPCSVPGRGRRGVITEPLEKTVMFLTAPKGQDSAAPSGLSDEDSRRQSLSEEFQPRWRNPGLSGQLETPRF